MDRINMAVGEHGGIELGGLFSVAIEPEARGYDKHGDLPPKSGGVGGLIGSDHRKIVSGGVGSRFLLFLVILM
jgi:hypothetical protein